MKKALYIAMLVSGLAALSFTGDPTGGFHVPRGWPAPTYDFSKNPLSKEKILLGRALFYDPVLSADSTISCASCHLQYTAFTHVDHQLSHGIGGRIGTRNSPALVNLAWTQLFMWDGAVNHLDMQPLAPISHPAEMGSGIDTVVMKLQRSAMYRQLFYNAFHDSTITGEHFLKAIGQFMAVLVSDNSKYDKVMRHEAKAEFTNQEANGYRIFKQHCNTCHREPLFTTGEFKSNGLLVNPNLNDSGRMRITHNSKDSLHFKVPSLRNVEYSFPYMHDGRFARLQDVINYYSDSLVINVTTSPELKAPLHLTPNEKVDLLAFLFTLTDKQFLYDTSFSFPRYIFLNKAKD